MMGAFGGGDFLAQRFQGLGRAGDQNQAGAFAGQGQGDAASDIAACARHQGDFIRDA